MRGPSRSNAWKLLLAIVSFFWRLRHRLSEGQILQVGQGYFSEGQRELSSTADLQRGYEVAPGKFVLVRPEELESLRKATSRDMQILRSVKMQEIDPVFLETSYYVIPGTGGERPYSLFYKALSETQLAALAQVAMHGREHVIVLRAGSKGLVAHTEAGGIHRQLSGTAAGSDCIERSSASRRQGWQAEKASG